MDDIELISDHDSIINDILIIIWSVIAAVTFLYITRIILFQAGFNRLREYRIQPGQTVTEPVSIVVPLRNEQDNIPGLLAALAEQEYPASSMEIILVNDHSVDGTHDLLKTIKNDNLLVVNMTDAAGKKEALMAGINMARNHLIITIDADCRFGKDWLRYMAGYFKEHDPAILIGPVTCLESKRLLHQMQALEFLSLIGITAGSTGMGNPIMGNGANLMFKKNLFYSFRSSDKTSTVSGDDVFFILWAKKMHPGRIRFLLSTEASARIPTHNRLADFLQQRLRWASKGRYYRDRSILTSAVTVYSFCFMQVFLLLFSLFERDFLYAALFMFLSKCLVDLIFMIDVTSKFRQGNLLKLFFPVQIMYPFYIFIIGTLGQFIAFKWKGRRYK